MTFIFNFIKYWYLLVHGCTKIELGKKNLGTCGAPWKECVVSTVKDRRCFVGSRAKFALQRMTCRILSARSSLYHSSLANGRRNTGNRASAGDFFIFNTF
jgi:hypothetical protein